MNQYSTYSPSQSRAEVLNAFMRGVYLWMTAGLAVTAVLAYFVLSSGMFMTIASNQILFFGLIFGELGLVIYLSARLKKMAASTATMLFIAYSGLNGLTIGTIVAFYTTSSVFSAFITTAGMFGAMSLYGLMTKKDLTSWGSFLGMGLFGIIIAMVVNIFLRSPAVSYIISMVGVVVFVGLTAYDTQKLKVMGESMPSADGEAVRKGTIMGALTLYLDFINLFLMLLRLMGGRD